MGVRIVSHTGGMGGVATSLAFAPDEGLAVVVLTNGGSSLPHDISHEVFAALLPEYARNLAKPREPANTAADELPEAVLGTWRGHVQTYNARLPLVLEIGRNSATASLAGNPAVPLRNLHMQDGYLAAIMDGDIGAPDANRREYALHFSLRPRGDILNGALSAIGKSSPKLPNALTSWVELQKSQP
jgi:hypothetical protein